MAGECLPIAVTDYFVRQLIEIAKQSWKLALAAAGSISDIKSISAKDIASAASKTAGSYIVALGEDYVLELMRSQIKKLLDDVFEEHPEILRTVESARNYSELAMGTFAMVCNIQSGSILYLVQKMCDRTRTRIEEKEYYLAKIRTNVQNINEAMESIAARRLPWFDEFGQRMEEAVDKIIEAQEKLNYVYVKLQDNVFPSTRWDDSKDLIREAAALLGPERTEVPTTPIPLYRTETRKEAGTYLGIGQDFKYPNKKALAIVKEDSVKPEFTNIKLLIAEPSSTGEITSNVELYDPNADFIAAGVLPNDILRIGGENYIISTVPSATTIAVRGNKTFPETETGVAYSIYRNEDPEIIYELLPEMFSTTNKIVRLITGIPIGSRWVLEATVLITYDALSPSLDGPLARQLQSIITIPKETAELATNIAQYLLKANEINGLVEGIINFEVSVKSSGGAFLNSWQAKLVASIILELRDFEIELGRIISRKNIIETALVTMPMALRLEAIAYKMDFSLAKASEYLNDQQDEYRAYREMVHKLRQDKDLGEGVWDEGDPLADNLEVLNQCTTLVKVANLFIVKDYPGWEDVVKNCLEAIDDSYEIDSKISSAISGFQMTENPLIEQVLNILDAFGLDKARDALLNGDIAGYFGMTVDYASYAGIAIACLRSSMEEAEDVETRNRLGGLLNKTIGSWELKGVSVGNAMKGITEKLASLNVEKAAIVSFQAMIDTVYKNFQRVPSIPSP